MRWLKVLFAAKVVSALSVGLSACGGAPSVPPEDATGPVAPEKADLTPVKPKQDALRPDTPELTEGRKLLEESRMQAAAGDLTGAEEKLRAALRATPNLPEAHFNLGLMAEWAGRVADARAAYEAALSNDPEFGPAVIALGLMSIREGKGAEAIRQAEARSAAVPKSLRLRNALNRLRITQGGFAALVVTETKAVLREDEKNVDGMVNLAAAFAEQGKHELALAILENAKALEPEDPEILLRMALSFEALNEPQKARLALEEAANLPSGATAEVYNNLGLIFHGAGDFAGAESLFRKALAKWPGMIQAQVNLGNALKGQQKYGDADIEFKRALAADPESADVLYNIGILYLDGALPDIEAIARLQKAVEYLEKYQRVRARPPEGDDPVVAYLAEARKRIEVEQKRLEQARKQPKGPESAPAKSSDAAEGVKPSDAASERVAPGAEPVEGR